MNIWGGDAVVWKKKGFKNERNGFVNESLQIEKRNNQVVVKKSTPRIKCWYYLMKALEKGVMMDCISKPTNSFWWVIVVVVFWHYGSLMNTEIIKILCIKMKNREYERAWLISIWNVTKEEFPVDLCIMYLEIGNENKTVALANQPIKHKRTIEIMLSW